MCLSNTTIPRGCFPSCLKSILCSTPDNGSSFHQPFYAWDHLESFLQHHNLHFSRLDIGRSHLEIWTQKVEQRWISQAEYRQKTRRLDVLINNWLCTNCCERASAYKASVAWRWFPALSLCQSLCHHKCHISFCIPSQLPHEALRYSHTRENSSCPNLQVVSFSRITQLNPASSASGSFWR